MQGFFVGMLDRIADPVLILLEKFDTLDLAAIGQKAGDALKVAVKWSIDMIDNAVEWGQTLLRWIKIAGAVLAGAFSPQFWESVGLTLKAMFLDAANVASGAFAGVVAGLQAGFQSAVEFLSTVMLSITKPEFWQGLAKTFEWLAMSLAEKLTGAIASLLEKIEKIPGVKKLLGSASSNLRTASDAMGVRADELGSEVRDNPVMQTIAEAAKKAATDTASAIANAYADNSNRFDTSGIKAAAEELMGHVEDEIAEAMKDPDPVKKVSEIMKDLLKKAAEIAVKTESTSPVVKGKVPLGSDNVFARDRARLGIASGLTTGGIGERRRVGKSNAEILGFQQKSLQEEGNDILADIRRDVKDAVTV
jgi:hypothetical protein